MFKPTRIFMVTTAMEVAIMEAETTTGAAVIDKKAGVVK
jgi:hypothetical protein